MVFSSFIFLCVKESSHLNNRKKQQQQKYSRENIRGCV